MTGQQARPQIDGFLLVDKPSGWTSHDVVARVRGMARQKKVGHAGTLDPMATGLLVLGLGRATRLMRYIQGGVKEYEATAQFGVATDSLDADGAIIAREPLAVSEAEVTAAAERFVGTIQQIPPMVSAKKIDGKRLYELARAGEEVERKPATVTIHSLQITDFAPSDYPLVTFSVRCSKGTYVRTLADDLAAALGGRAHLTALRRTRNGTLAVEDAHSMETLQAAADAGELAALVMSPAAGLGDLASIVVDDEAASAIRNGVPFPRSTFPDAEGAVRMLSGDGRLLAVYRAEGPRVAPEVVLA